jgi:hypothetical protein
MLLAILGTLAAPTAASATPGDTYALDIARPHGLNDPTPGRIIQIDPASGQEIREVPVNPPAEPLHAPVGIAIDAYGYLIVADTDGYNPTYTIGPYTYGGTTQGPYGPYECTNGCGAVLRINPADGSSQVLSTGPLWGNPSSVLLPPDRDLYDDGGGPEDELLVLDTAERAVIRVDVRQPANANQSYLYENYSSVNKDVNPAAVPGSRTGLRNPWDFARDPDRPNELLITNIGVRQADGSALGEPLEGVADCDDDANPGNGFAEPDGYIARLDATTGKINDYICDPEFRKPRGIVVASGERMFVTDPFAAGRDDNGVSRFAGVFRVTDRNVEMLSLGGDLQTPSGLSFTYGGNGLLVADESSYPPPIRDCAGGGGCGGVLALSPLSGDQSRYSPPGPATLFRDPIDVAVDRQGAPRPLRQKGICLRRKCCKGGPKCKPADRRVLSVLFFNLGPQAEAAQGKRGVLGIADLPLNGFGDGAKVRLTCASADCTSPPRTLKAVAGGVVFHFAPPLHGRFVVTAVAGKRTHIKTPYIGRFAYYSVDTVTGLPVEGKRGCLEPGEKTVTPETTIPCPEPDTK